jgi:thiol-disulfide isomerase/thioredoxin
MPMKTMLAVFAAILLCACATSAPKRGPSEPVSKMKNFDYGLDLTPTNGNKKTLADFKGKNISIYYLSPKCPHCRHAMPHIEKARKALDSLGYERVNICIKYSTDDDYTNFIREEKLTGSYFKDSKRSFGEKYGTGSIPVFFTVTDSGDVTRYNFVGDTLSLQVAGEMKNCCRD